MYKVNSLLDTTENASKIDEFRSKTPNLPHFIKNDQIIPLYDMLPLNKGYFNKNIVQQVYENHYNIEAFNSYINEVLPPSLSFLKENFILRAQPTPVLPKPPLLLGGEYKEYINSYYKYKKYKTKYLKLKYKDIEP